MPRNVTLLDLRTRVRQRANMENSTFVTDSEVSSLVNEGIAGLYNLLVQARGQEYYAANTSIATVANQSVYDLPAEFYQLLDITALISSETYKLKRYQMADIAALSHPGVTSPSTLPKYRIRGEFNTTTNVVHLQILPIPDQVYTISVYYVPAPVLLSADSDTCDGIAGFEEWVVLDAAIRCLQKEESDVSFLAAEREKVEARIRNLRDDRDAGDAPRVQDVRGRAVAYDSTLTRRWY